MVISLLTILTIYLEIQRDSNNAQVYYLPPAAESRSREIIKRLPYVRVCMRLSARSSHFHINLNISFIYKDIFTKFAVNVYGYKNLSVQNFGLIFKNKMAAISN